MHINESLLVREIRQNGWIKLENFINKDLIDKFGLRYDEIFHLCRNMNYENVSQIRGSSLRKFSEVNKIYQYICDRLGGFGEYNIELDKIWMVKSEYKDINISELPFVPHIDKRRLIKVMIYLSDVNVNDGPIALATVSPSRYEKLRKRLPANHKEKLSNVIKESLNYTAVTGSMGDAIVFDTNCPHFASQVDVGRCRKILRIDFSISPEFFNNSWIKKISKILHFKIR